VIRCTGYENTYSDELDMESEVANVLQATDRSVVFSACQSLGSDRSSGEMVRLLAARKGRQGEAGSLTTKQCAKSQ
jgi:hypothetical protein